MSGLDVASETFWTNESAWSETRKPIAEASALPAQCYTDEMFFAEEQRRVFGTSWVCVGLPSEVTVGTLIVRQVGGRSIIITRNANGDLRAFHNTCSHRGTELAQGDCSVGNTIRCPYHRWGYNLDGDLIASPRFAEAGVADFDPADFGLRQVQVDTWGCLLFVCLDNTTTPLADWLGDLPERMSGYALEHWVERERRSIDIAANWKLISENFQEYYHLAWIHPELVKVSRVDDHYRYQGPGMYCGQTTTPVSAGDRNDWLAMPPAAGLSPSDEQSGRFVTLFPNVLLSVLPNHIALMILHPISPGQTREDLIFLLPPTSTEVTEEAFAVTRDFWVDVNNEDIDIVSRGQRGLSSGGYTPGRLSPRFEEPLHRFHNMVADRFCGVTRIPAGDPADDIDILGSGVNPNPWKPEN
ncbi:MAG: aromatic ring-hydroxylating oxygenase subunit alpha [Acidimicrobiales bacterium]